MKESAKDVQTPSDGKHSGKEGRNNRERKLLKLFKRISEL